MKNPAFLFYPADFFMGTYLFTNEQVGKYIRLLCLQFEKGHLSLEEMKSIMGEEDPVIMKKFQKDKENLFFNKRLEEEITKRQKFIEVKIANGKKGGAPKGNQNARKTT